MDWTRKCAAVIPCFNEAANIGEVVSAVKRFVPNVLVVDDGSTDATARDARDAGAEILALGRNLGKGAALRAGWQWAHAQGFEWVLMLDGDGQHCADDIPKLFEAAERNGAKLIVGRRNMDAIPPVRRWVNRLMSRQLSKLAGMELPDSQCGFRLAEIATLMRLPFASEHFEIESEMLMVFARTGKKVDFVPVLTIYKDNASKIRPVRDTVRWLCWRLAQTHAKSRETARVPIIASELQLVGRDSVEP
ncbi:MAG TPA: glycosyltransferase family 2 protein [Verrucomicrobiae bacterium]|jgi:glycosyltransferase involved in cell wall biosynthesis